MIVNYKNAYEELKRLYERLEKENARLKDKIDKYIEIIENLYSEKEISKYQYEKYMSIAK